MKPVFRDACFAFACAAGVLASSPRALAQDVLPEINPPVFTPCDIHRDAKLYKGKVVRVIAVYEALYYARATFLSGGGCAPADGIPTLPATRTHGDASVKALFDANSAYCADKRTCGILTAVEVDILVRALPGAGVQAEFKHVYRSERCADKQSCIKSVERFRR